MRSKLEDWTDACLDGADRLIGLAIEVHGHADVFSFAEQAIHTIRAEKLEKAQEAPTPPGEWNAWYRQVDGYKARIDKLEENMPDVPSRAWHGGVDKRLDKLEDSVSVREGDIEKCLERTVENRETTKSRCDGLRDALQSAFERIKALEDRLNEPTEMPDPDAPPAPWSETPPTEPGWYWAIPNLKGAEPLMAEVIADGDRFLVDAGDTIYMLERFRFWGPRLTPPEAP